MTKIQKAIKFVNESFSDKVEVVCAWPRSTNFPGIWVLAKYHKTDAPLYNVYVCKSGFLTCKLTKIIPIGGAISKDHVTSLTDGNQVTWVSESLLDF